ncbi:MAG: hypothetical protein WC629_01165 [Candidatus Paceibacterota bacterium]|jgi:cytidylate kinase
MKNLFSQSIAVTSQIEAGKTPIIEGLRAQFSPFCRFVDGGMLWQYYAEVFKKKDPRNIDYQVDTLIHGFAQSNFTVVESNIANCWMTRSFSVLLRCNLRKRAEMYAERKNITLYEAETSIKHREVLDRRFLRTYGARCVCQRPDYFDLVIDTGIISSDEIVTKICKSHEKWKEKNFHRITDGVVAPS